jgi:hypothetical protein
MNISWSLLDGRSVHQSLRSMRALVHTDVGLVCLIEV